MSAETIRFPTDWLRGQFPSLQVEDNGQRRIYLDNPAGTQVPFGVATAITDAVLFSNANLGGEFETSVKADSIIEAGHRAMASFLGCDPREVVIGPNMTSLTYHFSRLIGHRLDGTGLKEGDEIIVTQMDHEGNVSPWLQLADDLGLVVRKVPFNTDSWQVEADDLRAVLTDRTRVLALNHSSNLTGTINKVRELVSIARDAGVLTYVDSVQFAPHGLVDVREIECDFLVCSSYKFFGPHLGILYGKEQVLERLDAYKCRCSDDTLPYRFETGTPQIELVAGLAACVEHFVSLGNQLGNFNNNREAIAAAFAQSGRYENELAARLIGQITKIEGLTIHGITSRDRMEERVPTISFTLADISPHTLVERLNREGIFCWSGHNYAWEVVHQLGINPEQGVVRIGIANYNTASEIDETVESLQRNIAMLRQQR